ncbi:hypothetical protein FACS189476_10830 [Spirochaetia bacterium]|nr:hypothetical protein FACS189476_10830 [Spirochaetia bacterium]
MDSIIESAIFGIGSCKLNSYGITGNRRSLSKTTHRSKSAIRFEFKRYTKLLEKITKILKVSASALFYTPEEKSSDDSFLTVVDQIVEKELTKTVEAIKLEIRHREAP